LKLFASLYLDEDVSILVADILRARGFEVTTVRDEKMLGRSDSEQLEKAISLQRCLFTHKTGSITKNSIVKPLQGKRNTLALSSGRVETRMNWLAASPHWWTQ
jgi:predicted nuclease of predicted toxin-antitoxin system